MRYTQHRHYPAEERHVDEAGASLHGGHDGTQPVLADAVDADLHTIAGHLGSLSTRVAEHTAHLTAVQAFIDQFPNLRLQTGRTTITFASADAHSHRITFPTPFAAVPVIVPNIDVAPAATARWDVRAINAATTGFTFFVYSNATGADTAWNNIQVSWLALSLTG